MPHKPKPHAQNLRTGRISEPFTCYAITKSVAGRRKLLTSAPIAKIILESWNYLRKTNEIKLLAFCLMPDHYHLLLCLLENKALSEVMESTNKFTGREINKHLGRQGRFWQEGFHDHRCRDDDETDELSIYIEHNPVRAGLVEMAEQWPFSSACPGCVGLLDRGWYAQVK